LQLDFFKDQFPYFTGTFDVFQRKTSFASGEKTYRPPRSDLKVEVMMKAPGEANENLHIIHASPL